MPDKKAAFDMFNNTGAQAHQVAQQQYMLDPAIQAMHSAPDINSAMEQWRNSPSVINILGAAGTTPDAWMGRVHAQQARYLGALRRLMSRQQEVRQQQAALSDGMAAAEAKSASVKFAGAPGTFMQRLTGNRTALNAALDKKYDRYLNRRYVSTFKRQNPITAQTLQQHPTTSLHAVDTATHERLATDVNRLGEARDAAVTNAINTTQRRALIGAGVVGASGLAAGIGYQQYNKQRT